MSHWDELKRVWLRRTLRRPWRAVPARARSCRHRRRARARHLSRHRSTRFLRRITAHRRSRPAWCAELDDDVDEPSAVDPPRRRGRPPAGTREPRRPKAPSDAGAVPDAQSEAPGP